MTKLVKLPGAMARPTQRRYSPRLPREQRRDQLLDATLKLIARHGLTGVSMEAVAREAEIAKTVVYEAFGDKPALLQALFEREQQRVLTAIAAAVPVPPLAGDPAEILAASITTALEAVRRHPDAWRLILLPADGMPLSLREEVSRHRDGLVRQIEPMVAWGGEQLGLGHLDHELAAHTIIGAAEDAARLTLAHPKRFPPERIAEFTVELIRAFSRGEDER